MLSQHNILKREEGLKMDFLSLSPANEIGDKIVRKRIIDACWYKYHGLKSTVGAI